MDVLNPSSL